MRADRLLALLLILQSRGRQTAAHLAAELEVTERTIYRDIQALSSAGVPVYTERGPGGGIALVEDYRTNLTGLTATELRALFLLSIPAPLHELGLGEELQAALRKLAAALPAARQPELAGVPQRIHLDWTPWTVPGGPAPHLARIQQALWHEKLLDLTYRSPFFGDWIAPLHIQAAPYGLVAKAGGWYLVCAVGDHLQVIPVSSILEAVSLAVGFSRPASFDLPAFWQAWCAAELERRPRYNVCLRLAPEGLPILRRRFAAQLDQALRLAPPAAQDGWRQVVLDFESQEDARTFLLGCGRVVEVLAPLALRLSLVDFARQVVDFYSVL